jgi:hypothetical protein
MYAIFITEMLKTPLIQILDVFGNLKKHVLAPRSQSLKKMSKFFRGTRYDLSERYTNMTKVIFMTFYYSMIFPASYFLAAATLAVHYWVDKFCLLRVWAPAPELGSSIGKVSRNYFLKFACIFYVMKSAYNYASFPFDNACGKSCSTKVAPMHVASVESHGNWFFFSCRPTRDRSDDLCWFLQCNGWPGQPSGHQHPRRRSDVQVL